MDEQATPSGEVTRRESMDGRLVVLTSPCVCGGELRGTFYSNAGDTMPFTHHHWLTLHCQACAAERKTAVTHDGHARKPWWPTH
jgi:hypothetical protein